MARIQYSEEKILSVSKTALNNARENLIALSVFGVTEEMLNQFQSDINTTEALPDDDSLKIDLKNFTHSKDEALDACYQWGRKLRTRLQLAFGRNSIQLNSFPSSKFNQAISSESKMMPVMETLYNIANQYQTQLATYGQTPEIVEQCTVLLNSLREADAVQESKKDDKKSSTQDRYIKFNVLYDMVNRINKIGRLVFENDPVKLPLFESKW